MSYRFFKRIFTNNNNYGDDTIPYMDSLAYTVKEFLYEEGFAVNKLFDCQMDGHIFLYDFMSIVHFFIEATNTEFARITIDEYIASLQYAYNPDYPEFIEHKNDKLCITNASDATIVSMLWTTLVYTKVRRKLEDNKWSESEEDILYKMMADFLRPLDLEDCPLTGWVDDAVETMEQHILNKQQMIRKNESNTDENTWSAARIKELEAEVEKMKNDIVAYESQGKGVSASKHALLLTTLCHHLGGLPQNGRQSLSPILQKLYGYTEATATRALNQKFKQTDVDALAKLFSGLSPRVGNAIKEMPSIIEKQNNERLRKLNEQKNG